MFFPEHHNLHKRHISWSLPWMSYFISELASSHWKSTAQNSNLTAQMALLCSPHSLPHCNPIKADQRNSAEPAANPWASTGKNVLLISINLLQCWQRVKIILHINWLPCDMKKIPSKFLFFWDIPGPLFPLASACRTGNPFSLHHSEAPTVAVTVLFDQKKAFFSVNQVH